MPTSLQSLNYASESDIWSVLEVDQLPKDVTAHNNVSGTNTQGGASVKVVRAPSDTMLPPPGYAVDVWGLWIEYCIDHDGSYPDVELTFQIGNKSVGTVAISGGYTRNMFPHPDRIRGGKVVPFARSMRSLYNLMQKGQSIRNLALQIVGLKIPSQQALRVSFKSSTGWGTNHTPIRPLRVYLLADMWTDGELANFQSAYNGSFRVERHPSGTIAGSHQLSTTLSAKTMGILPGGLDQAHTTEIFRKLTYAVNGNAITTGSAFRFSNESAVGGQQNNVVDTTHDLGLPFKDTRDAFIPYEIGFNFAESQVGQGANPQINVGWWDAHNRHMIPDMHSQGVLISAQRNPFQYGSTVPQISEGNNMFAMPSADKLVSLLVQDANWCPAVSAINLSSGFDAGEVYALMGGIEIKGL